MEEVKDLVSSKCSHGHFDEEILHLGRMVDLPFHRGRTFGPWTSPYLKGNTIKTVSTAIKEETWQLGRTLIFFARQPSHFAIARFFKTSDSECVDILKLTESKQSPTRREVSHVDLSY
jgi:hypothetical protein